MVRDKQLRLVYSLLKPALRMAARFNVPIRSLTELLRLAYYEVLLREGLSQAQIAERFGQSTRHVRSLARRHDSDFFRAEKEIGRVREVEDHVAEHEPDDEALGAAFPDVDPDELAAVVERLLAEERIERGPDGRLRVGHPYVILGSDTFHHRIDALNHHLDAAFRAVVQRMIFDERETAMIKTISFSSSRAGLAAFLRRLEGDLRRDLATLEERSAFEGAAGHRYTLGLTVASAAPEPEE